MWMEVKAGGRCPCREGREGLAGSPGSCVSLSTSGYVLSLEWQGVGWTIVGKQAADFKRGWVLVRSVILKAAPWLCVRVGAGGCLGEGKGGRGGGGQLRAPFSPSSSRGRVSSPCPSLTLPGAPVPSPGMLVD